MTRPFPAPETRNPVQLDGETVHEGIVFLKPVLTHPRITVGDYTYASAFDPPLDWASRLAPYLFEFSPEKLVLGRFCQIADGVQFITASANHRHDGFSSFPFAIFGGGFEGRASMPGPGADTVIGNDVWIGQGARILPGARLGDGCIVGAGAVVGGSFAPYSVIAGNPGKTVRRRFPDPVAQRLTRIAWWDWPIELILSQEAAICGGDLAALEAAARLAGAAPPP